MNAMQIDLCILIGCVIALAAADLWLWKRLRMSSRQLTVYKEMYARQRRFKRDFNASLHSKATVTEVIDGFTRWFVVSRNGICDKIAVARYYYSPNDPDDREYKRIHAEEVAEKLNERP